jgi:hypothetical protein
VLEDGFTSSIKACICDLKKVDLATIDDVYLERQIRELLNVGYVSRLLELNLPRVYRACTRSVSFCTRQFNNSAT